MNYRPPHDSRNRPSLVPEKPPTTFFGSIIIGIQLIGILALVRVAMLEQDVVIFHLPGIDPLLRQLISGAKYYLTLMGLYSTN